MQKGKPHRAIADRIEASGLQPSASSLQPPASSLTAGITLIELLVVVTIIGLFAALVAPRLWNKITGAKQTVARQQINDFMTALGAYKLDTGAFPTTEQGLQALRTKPSGVERWDGPYLPKDVPNDPWGHAYIYKYPGDHGDEPDLISLGADGREGGDSENADILSWKNK